MMTTGLTNSLSSVSDDELLWRQNNSCWKVGKRPDNWNTSGTEGFCKPPTCCNFTFLQIQFSFFMFRRRCASGLLPFRPRKRSIPGYFHTSTAALSPSVQRTDPGSLRNPQSRVDDVHVNLLCCLRRKASFLRGSVGRRVQSFCLPVEGFNLYFAPCN